MVTRKDVQIQELLAENMNLKYKLSEYRHVCYHMFHDLEDHVDWLGSFEENLEGFKPAPGHNNIKISLSIEELNDFRSWLNLIGILKEHYERDLDDE